MAFEAIVRPSVIPNIRPTPSQSVPTAATDPTKGSFTIHGTSGKFIELPYSWSVSTSESRPQETKRRVDEFRIYQKTDDGIINKDNYVDVDVANKVWMQEAGLYTTKYKYCAGPEKDHIKRRKKNKILICDEITGQTIDSSSTRAKKKFFAEK
jgi:hypothetical protein